VSEITV
jgi:ATP-binding cassette, subfamily C (CFTR/MRP), member 1